ncbi:serine threonine- kinase pim-3-like protein [Labeo rohita]|uniref:Serine threonine-kinase pim-3-like protein n=1 Tax=Labeo rohita TaxID=84645 RepID=A0A498NYW3_LABRO|nr:serine threonine- kinase pim-3-like protein [Labeo rohita]
MAAGQEVGGQCGDHIQKTLSNPTQSWSPELPGYIAPLPSESTQRKRKRQSLEDEDPSTSYERPAKRSREGQAYSQDIAELLHDLSLN